MSNERYRAHGSGAQPRRPAAPPWTAWLPPTKSSCTNDPWEPFRNCSGVVPFRTYSQVLKTMFWQGCCCSARSKPFSCGSDDLWEVDSTIPATTEPVLQQYHLGWRDALRPLRSRLARSARSVLLLCMPAERRGDIGGESSFWASI